jgi:hypothetical protein
LFIACLNDSKGANKDFENNKANIVTETVEASPKMPKLAASVSA